MTAPPLRIAVAEDEPDTREFFQRILPRLGHDVVGVAADGDELVSQCRTSLPDLVITDIRMPRLDGISAVAQICRERPIPAVILSAHYDEQSLQPLLDEHVFAFLIKPVRTSDLCAAIELAMERHRQFNLLLQQSDTLPQARADRRLVEQAKSLLQTRSGLSEVQAFDRLVVLAEQRQVRLVEIARLLHVVGEAFRPVPNE